MTYYDRWLEEPYTRATDLSAEYAYEEYVAEMRKQSDREFSEGGHDYTDPDEYFASLDMVSEEDYIQRWLEDREMDLIERAADERFERDRLER